MDIWVLFSVSGNPKLKTKVQTTVARLGASKQLNAEQLLTSIRNHGSSLDGLFPSMLSLAQGSLSSLRLGSQAHYTQQFGFYLYQLLYEEFSSGVRRQDIVAHLIGHASSTIRREADMAFQVRGLLMLT
jgi:Fanconi anaemia protein FancD2 nuclease